MSPYKASRQKVRRLRRKRSWCQVYGIQDDAGDIRYVGQTRQTLQDRERWLVKAARAGQSPVEAWLREQVQQNRVWRLVCLDGNATWDVSEILWIERLRSAGRLLNVTRGGRDCPASLAREGRA